MPVVLCFVFLLGNVSNVSGGSIMFRKWSADQLAEAEAIITSQEVAGKILTGEKEFEKAPTSTDPREIYLVVRVRALSRQSIWGDLECIVDQRGPVTIAIPVPVAQREGWVYYALNFKSAGLKNPTVAIRWKRIYAK